MNASRLSILSAAVSGILLGLPFAALAAQPATRDGERFNAAPNGAPLSDTADAGSKHGCKGQNACKGQGGCKTEKHACKGQNACKGQGGCRTDGKM